MTTSSSRPPTLALSPRPGMTGSEVLKIASEVRALTASGRSVANLTVGDFSPTEFRIPRRLEQLIAEALAGRTDELSAVGRHARAAAQRGRFLPRRARPHLSARVDAHRRRLASDHLCRVCGRRSTGRQGHLSDAVVEQQPLHVPHRRRAGGAGGRRGHELHAHRGDDPPARPRRAAHRRLHAAQPDRHGDGEERGGSDRPSGRGRERAPRRRRRACAVPAVGSGLLDADVRRKPPLGAAAGRAGIRIPARPAAAPSGGSRRR